jgi:hypothetical protein
MLVKEIATIVPKKPLTPAQSRINSLKLQKDNVGKQLKAERDRQRIAKAQQRLSSALHPTYAN